MAKVIGSERQGAGSVLLGAPWASWPRTLRSVGCEPAMAIAFMARLRSRVERREIAVAVELGVKATRFAT